MAIPSVIQTRNLKPGVSAGKLPSTSLSQWPSSPLGLCLLPPPVTVRALLQAFRMCVLKCNNTPTQTKSITSPPVSALHNNSSSTLFAVSYFCLKPRSKAVTPSLKVLPLTHLHSPAWGYLPNSLSCFTTPAALHQHCSSHYFLYMYMFWASKLLPQIRKCPIKKENFEQGKFNRKNYYYSRGFEW